MLEYEIEDDVIQFTCLHCYNTWNDEDAELSNSGEPELPVVCPFCVITHYSMT